MSGFIFDTTPLPPFLLRVLDLPSPARSAWPPRGCSQAARAELARGWHLGSGSHPTPYTLQWHNSEAQGPHSSQSSLGDLHSFQWLEQSFTRQCTFYWLPSLSLPHSPGASPGKGFTGPLPQGLLPGNPDSEAASKAGTQPSGLCPQGLFLRGFSLLFLVSLCSAS